MNSEPIRASWMTPEGTEWMAAAVVYWNDRGEIGVRVQLAVDGELVASTSTTDVT